MSNALSTRGAGDCFVAGAVWRLARAGGASSDEANVRAAVRAGLRAARLNVLSEDAVPPSLSAEELLRGEEQEA